VTAEHERTGAAYVEIEGERQLLLPTALDACDGFEPVEIRTDMTCDDSGPIDGPWTGLDLGELLTAAESPPAATHVLVTCRDGYRVCLDVTDALSAVLAYRRDGDPLGPDEIRVVGPGVGSARSAKGVARIEPVTLDAGTDPTEIERLSPDESDTPETPQR
jgi:DMSO/TMAO reductase YedYZ molybdopterin-dependent catalytic subunit